MTVNLFTFVGMFSHALNSLDHLLEKGEAHAKTTGVSEADMLEWRLIGDMHPLAFQVRTVCNLARQWTARAAGIEVPGEPAADLDMKGLKAAVADARAYLAALKPEQFEGRDDVELTVALGPIEPTLPIGRWISVFATTNLYFHLSTTYDILRARGVPVGKPDLFAGQL